MQEGEGGDCPQGSFVMQQLSCSHVAERLHIINGQVQRCIVALLANNDNDAA